MEQLFTTKFGFGQNGVINVQSLLQFFAEKQQAFKTEKQCRALIAKYGTNDAHLTQAQFLRMLLDEPEFALFSQAHRSVCQSMDHPMTHYFIASSHNTYLTGNQLTSKSSADMYRRVLLQGCRCVEIDIWHRSNMPVVTHGRTLTTQISLLDVLRTINDYAFQSSPYPVILSIENHLPVNNQRTMAQMMRHILGDKLYIGTISPGETQFPSPNQFKGKIFIKGRKIPEDYFGEIKEDLPPSYEELFVIPMECDEKDHPQEQQRIDISPEDPPSAKVILRKAKRDLPMPEPYTLQLNVFGDAKIQMKLDQEFSDLVNYFQTRKYLDFSECKNFKFYEMISHSESGSSKLIKKDKFAYRRFTCTNMVRVYPLGLRVDSTNFNPLPHWSVGVQLVALNYQTLSLPRITPMLLNRAMFELNGQCGYVLKPEHLRTLEKNTKRAKPFNLTVTILFAQLNTHLLQQYSANDKFYVSAKLYSPGRKIEKRTTKRVKSVQSTLLWNRRMQFACLSCAELTFLRVVLKSSGDFIGQYIIAAEAIQSGYRRIGLLDAQLNELPGSSILVHVTRSVSTRADRGQRATLACWSVGE